MTANLQPNDELDLTTTNDTPQATDDIQDTTIPQPEEAVEATVESEITEPEASATEPEPVATTTDPEATTEPEPVATTADTTSAHELELTAERPALTDADQEYYGFAVTGNPDGSEPVTPLWEKVVPGASADRPKAKRLTTAALVCAVAAVSFVAGGLASRMSSQVPVLFGQGESAQSVASYKPYATQRDAEDETDPFATTNTDQQADPRTPDNSTTRKQDDADSSTKDKGSNRYTIPVDEDSSGSSNNKSPRGNGSSKNNDDSNKWYYNTNGDESISYDSDEDTYTIDYDGYTFTVPTDDFFDEEMIERWYRPNGDSYYDYYLYDYGYGDETGYDTEEDRDRRSWGGQSDKDTSDAWDYGYDDYDGYDTFGDYFFGWDEYRA